MSSFFLVAFHTLPPPPIYWWFSAIWLWFVLEWFSSYFFCIGFVEILETGFIVFMKCGNYLAIISLNFFFCSSPYPFSRIPTTCTLVCLILSHSSVHFLLIFFPMFYFGWFLFYFCCSVLQCVLLLCYKFQKVHWSSLMSSLLLVSFGIFLFLMYFSSLEVQFRCFLYLPFPSSLCFHFSLFWI